MKYSEQIRKYLYDEYVKHMRIYFWNWSSFEEIDENYYFEEDYKKALIIFRKQKLTKLNEKG